MSLEVIEKAIISRFETEVTKKLSLPTVYENAPVADDEPLHRQPDSGEWVEFSIANGNTDQADVGAATKRFRNYGQLNAIVHVPSSSGTGRLMQLCDKIKDAFKAKTVGGITYRSATVTKNGDDGDEYTASVAVAFFSDDFS